MAEIQISKSSKSPNFPKSSKSSGKSNTGSKTKLGRIVAGIMGGSLVVAIALLGVSTSTSASAGVPVTSRHLLSASTLGATNKRMAQDGDYRGGNGRKPDGVARMGFYDNIDQLDPASAYKCTKVLKHMKAILPPKSVDCAQIADGARNAADLAADEWRQLTADDLAEAAGAASLAVKTAADAANTAVTVAAAAAATGPDAPQTAAIAEAAAKMIAETAAKAADAAAAQAAKHAMNVRGIARALTKMASTAADATPATLIGAASETGKVATEEETDAVALRAAISRRTVMDAVANAEGATAAVEIAMRAHTQASDDWRHEVVAQGDDARQGAKDVANIATTGRTTAMVAVEAAQNVKKVAVRVAAAAEALAKVAPAVATETAAFAKLTTARAVARGTSGLCVRVPEGFTYGGDGVPQPTNVCDASAPGAALATLGDCRSDLPFGESCEPVCIGGYELASPSTCSADGTFDSGTCRIMLDGPTSCATLAADAHGRVAHFTELWKQLTADDVAEAADLAAVSVATAVDAAALAVATAAQGAKDVAAIATTGITTAHVAALAAKTLADTVNAAAATTADNAAKHAYNVRQIAGALKDAATASADATAADIHEASAAAGPVASEQVAAKAASRMTASKDTVGSAAASAEAASEHATAVIQASTDAATAWRESVIRQTADASAAAKLAVEAAAQGAIDVANIAQTQITTAMVAATAAETTAATAVQAAENVKKVAAAVTVAADAAAAATVAVTAETAAHDILTGTQAVARGNVGLCVRL